MAAKSLGHSKGPALSANGLPDRRLFLAADSVECSTGNELDRAAAQRCLLDIVDAAAGSAKLPRLSWNRRHTGPGELAELPTEELESQGIDRFLGELDAELFHHNITRRLTDRLRIRVAIHYGQTARMVDSTMLHQALRLCPQACLGVLLSADVFDGMGTRLRREWLRKVRLRSHTFTGTAWLLVPGYDVRALRLRGSGIRLPAARVGSRRVVEHQAEGVSQAGTDHAHPMPDRGG